MRSFCELGIVLIIGDVEVIRISIFFKELGFCNGDKREYGFDGLIRGIVVIGLCEVWGYNKEKRYSFFFLDVYSVAGEIDMKVEIYYFR